MPEYGLTDKGPNIKRLDVILDEMHDDLTEKWGVNTRQNPQSFLNHLLTNIADHLAELWEFGEMVYFSQYPATAEGISLDNVAQIGGSTRNIATKSYYPVHCKGIDGTVLTAGTVIATTTNPSTQLTIVEDYEMSREYCHAAEIKVAAVEAESVYSVAINGSVYSYTSEDEGAKEILQGLAKAITSEEVTATVDEENEILTVESKQVSASLELVLTENLTTKTVTCIVSFGTVDTGDILLPEGVITNIVKADPGLLSVVNLCAYIAGRDDETDTEFRQSYHVRNIKEFGLSRPPQSWQYVDSELY